MPIDPKWLILTGLIMQAAAALPPAWVFWHPDPWAFSGELGIPTKITEILSKRDKRLLVVGLALLFTGAAFQIIGLLLQP